MTDFYLKTSDEAVAGPFTGIELREAAMARLVMPDTGVAATADGPWRRAAEIGLFSDNSLPVPHPAGTPVPEFRLTGASEAGEGPYRLRELIDFAVLRMLTNDSSIQPVGRNDWIRVDQFGILAACLRGELAGNPTPVTAPPVSSNPLQLDPDRSFNSVDAREPKAEPPPMNPIGASKVGPPTPSSDAPDADLVDEPDEVTDSMREDHREQARKNIRERIENRRRLKYRSAYAVAFVTLILCSVSVWWMFQLQSTRTDRSKVVGSWVRIPSNKTGKAFGISFNEDGTCVVFNSDGACWSGDYQLSNDATSAEAFQSLSPMNNQGAELTSNHHRDAVTASDGFVRLEGESSSLPPMLGDHPIRACFVRKDEEFLWIGYPTNVDPSNSSESLNAAWVQLWPRNNASEIGPLDAGIGGTDLLARYGVPDEARPLRPNEIIANRDPKSAEPRSLVRYGTQRLTLDADGSIHRFKDP